MAKRNAGSSSTIGIDASITMMVASMGSNLMEKREISDERWKAMLETQQAKLMLEKEKGRRCQVGSPSHDAQGDERV
jgi:hypothetical protein